MEFMKNFSLVLTVLLLISLCGCSSADASGETRFMLDTVVTVNADCSEKIINSAFLKISDFEELLSATKENSDVSRLNIASPSGEFIAVSEDTLKIIDRCAHFSEISGGKFDITVRPLTKLWDFKNKTVPSNREISEALRRVGYGSIEEKNGKISLHGAEIDLGAAAKGYIADKTAEFLKARGAKSAVINLGGNIVCFGKEMRIAIKKPFSESEYSGYLNISDRSVVTSGIYERYFEKSGELYHHIIDPKTGRPADTDISGATVISPSSLDADILSTCCVLLGSGDAMKLIEETSYAEAVIIKKNGDILYTSGLKKIKNDFYLK